MKLCARFSVALFALLILCNSFVPSRASDAAGSATASTYINANLPNMDFSNQNLIGADFSNATLTSANFSGANLAGAKFINANLAGANFANALLPEANLTNAILSEANLTNADFSYADLSNATLDHALAVNTHFDGATLINANMGSLIHKASETRPTFIDAHAISSALAIDPAHPSTIHKIDLTINFDFNADKLTADGQKQVQQVAAALQDAPLLHARIMVEGHTDNIGSDIYNKDLSYRRATRVLRSLIEEYSIAPSRLSAQGFGKTKPIASNDSDLGRAMNRRVTLVNLGS